jgi:hypothetical protein
MSRENAKLTSAEIGALIAVLRGEAARYAATFERDKQVRAEILIRKLELMRP